MPTIEPLDPTITSLKGTVVLPRRFRARFAAAAPDVDVALEVEVIAGTPEIRSVTVSSSTKDLDVLDLRLRLRTDLLSKAIFAACTTLIEGTPTTQKMRPVDRPKGRGNIGPIQIVGRVRRDFALYRADPTPDRQPGRPHHVTSDSDLAEVAEAYDRRQSIADVVNSCFLSRSTAKRRVEEARERGFLKARN